MKLKITVLFICVLVSQLTYGYEESSYLDVTYIRTLGNTVYFETSAIAICNTNTLTIDASQPGGKEMFSTLLSASMAGKKVKLETWGVCSANGGWGTPVGGVSVKLN